MIVYSVEWQDRRQVKHRTWFASEREAETWMFSEDAQMCRVKIGPSQHRIEGKAGLLSFLRTYRK